MSALSRLTVTETRLFLREPMIVFFALAFPPILFVILGARPGVPGAAGDPRRPAGDRPVRPDRRRDGRRGVRAQQPVQLLATYREKGVLRRMRTTPVKPEVMLGAQLLMSTVLSVVMVLVVLAVGRLAFGVAVPRHLPAYLVGYLLTALSMFAIGLLVASLAPTGKSAGAAGTLLFFPIVFFAGLWIPRDDMTDALRTISDFTPLGAGVQALQDATAGHWPPALYLAVMLGWTIVAGGLAARYFRWE